MLREFSPVERMAAVGLARNDLYFFSRWMFRQRKNYNWLRSDHHRIICDALMRVFNGECKRLIINIPPRYSKTELAVINFMAWALGKVPDAEFIHTSYSGDLAANNSWQARELVQHPAYREIFPEVQLRRDSKARDEWHTTDGGCVYAVGARGGITGYGAGKQRPGFGGAIIIDDPHKADEARSDVMRKSVIEWFQNTLESRKNDPQNTPIILIMQRLHENDLSGWLLGDRKDGKPVAGGNGEVWEHVCLSAEQPDGTALWPAKHSIEDLHRMERAAPYMYAGQYAQRPAPLAGGIFRPLNIKIIDALPAGKIQWMRGWDLASLEDDGDYTVGGKLGMLEDGRYVIADIERGQLAPEERDTVMVNTAALDGRGVRISIPQDPGQAGKTQVLDLGKKLKGYKVQFSPESGDKVTRAEPFASQVNVGNVLMVRAPWNDAVINEMKMFPNAAHDDIIDALARAFAGLLEKKRSYFG